jgi:uncharacterized protein YfdQ (DUF2303 family)
MKPLLLIAIFCYSSISALRAQDCPMYYPDKENTQMEYKQYDKKGGLSGSSIQKITSIKKTAASTEIAVSAESFDAKGKSLGTANLKARCEGGVFYVDMSTYLNMQSTEAYKDMEMSVEGGNLEMPSGMKAGDALKDGNLKMSFSSGGMTIMNMTVSITNRKVEAVENVTTPAGTFECYKISYDIATKVGITMKMNSVEWYANKVGMIKSETYKDGKLMGSNVLSALK